MLSALGKRGVYEFISPEVTKILSLDPDRPICFGTNIKGLPYILLRAKLAQILIGWAGSKLKIFVTTEDVDSLSLYRQGEGDSL